MRFVLRLALLHAALVLGAAFGPCGPGGPRRPDALSRAPQRRLRLCQEEPPKLDDKDWRAFRARLVAAQQAEGGGEGGGGGASTTSEGGFMYATPLIEQGSVILGGTDQEFGFALRQQYFHKCVILLLTHDEGFTKGIILNRPSALTLDGWRLWFGGDVAQGGLFRKAEPWKTSLEKETASSASSGLEMVCLHSLTSEAARRLSLPVISGVWQTSFEVAKSLVDDGEAAKEDFCVFAGYAGWGPTQLQGEVERDSWFLAAADSSVLLQELLQQAREVPTNRAGDGLRTWDTLMEGIGKAEQAGQSRGCLSDRTLGRWVDAHLYPPPAATDDEAGDEAEGEAGRVKGSLVGQLLRTRVASEDATSAADTADAAVGAVLEDQFRKALSSLAADGTYTVGLGADVRGPPMARTRAPEYALSEQFLHKALLLVVLDTSESGQQPLLPEQPAMCVAVVLNRPTANVVQVHTDNKPRRHITFGGEARLRGGVAGLDVDSNGLLWLHHRDGITGGTEVGDSGVYRMPGNDAAALVKAGEATLEDFLVVAGVVAMPRDELLSRMDCGDMQTVTGGAVLYPQLWALTDATDGARAEEQIPLELSDGTALWWAATQLGGGGAAAGEAAELTMPSLPASELADDTLAEWLKFFAGHQGREDE